MVLEEKFTEVRSLDELRKMIRDAEKRHNVKVHYLVGTKEDVTEEEAYLAIPLFKDSAATGRWEPVLPFWAYSHHCAAVTLIV